MKIGTTTFGFRYSFLDRANSMKLAEVIRQVRAAGVERLQVCENVHPLEISKSDWDDARRCAADLGVELQLGCKTLRPETVENYMRLAEELQCNQLRIVMEEHAEHATRENAVPLLENIVPKMRAAGMRLAIENHFDIPSALLVELAAEYAAKDVGFCVDTANSLRSFEPTHEVFDLLGSRAFCYHLKDFRVIGGMISFSVVGTPLGEGQLDLDACLKYIFDNTPDCPLFVETWTPGENDRAGDAARELDWLQRSVTNLRGALKKYVS